MFSLIRSTVLAAVTALAIVGFRQCAVACCSCRLGGHVTPAIWAGQMIGRDRFGCSHFCVFGVDRCCGGRPECNVVFSLLVRTVRYGSDSDTNTGRCGCHGSIRRVPHLERYCDCAGAGDWWRCRYHQWCASRVFDFQFTNANTADWCRFLSARCRCHGRSCSCSVLLGGLGYLSRRRNKEPLTT